MAEKQSLFNLGMTVAMAGVGMALGGNPLPAACAGMIGNIAGNMAGDLYKDGLATFEEKFLSSDGLLNHDIAAALGRAMEKTLRPETLVKDFEADGDYLRLKRHRPPQAELCLNAVKGLAVDLQKFLAESTSDLNNSLKEADLQDLALQYSTTAPQTAFNKFLQTYAHGHDSFLLPFLQRRLQLTQLPNYFIEELKQNTEAWRAMQMLFQKSLLDALANLQTNETKLLEMAEQEASDVAVIKANVARLTQTAHDADQVKAALEAVLAQPLAELQAKLQTILANITTEGKKTRDHMTRKARDIREHVTQEHEATRNQLSGKFEEQAEQNEQQYQQVMAELAALRQQMIEASNQRALRRAEWLSGPRPVSASRFFDRVRELNDLRQTLQQTEVSLMVIIGRGGMGKTALTARLLDDLEATRAQLQLDGIACFSGQGGRLGLSHLYEQVQRMLGGQTAQDLQNFWQNQAPLEQKANYLLSQLRQGRYLLVLDNLEDCLTEEGLPEDDGLRLFLQLGLTMQHGAHVLITSRQPLQFRQGRQRLKELPLRQGLPEAESMAFLQQWDADGTLGLRDAPPPILADLARRTHGIPRALEFVGALLANDETLTPQDLLNDPRLWQQEIVAALLTESYRRLIDPPASRVLEALAILGRPVPFVAVQFLTLGGGQPIDPPLLAKLVKRAFVTFDRTTSEYSLHPLDLEYLLGQLPEPEGLALHARAADYYAHIRLPQAQWHALADVLPQLLEFEQRLAMGQYDEAARVLETTVNYLHLWEEYRLLVELHKRLQGKLTDKGLQSYNLRNLGVVYNSLGQINKAIGYYEQALVIDKEIGYRRGESADLGNLGSAYSSLGQVEKAIGYYEQALTIIKEIGDRKREGIWLGNLGNAYRDLEQVEKAIGYYEQALIIAKEIDDRHNEGTWLSSLGMAYLSLGQVDKVDYIEQALAIDKEIGNRVGEGIQLCSFGVICFFLGQVDNAIGYYEQALIIAKEIGDRRREGIWSWNLGLVYEQSDPAKAADLMEVRVRYEREVGHPDAEGDAARVAGLRVARH